MNAYVKQLDEIIQAIDVTRTSCDYTLFAYSEESAKKMREMFPGYNIRVIPSYCKFDDVNEENVFIIPVDNNKPIKFVFEEQ